jgi:iron complex transport system substrate-binding protein
MRGGHAEVHGEKRRKMNVSTPCRIVSLEPSITAMLYALGQQARVVAVSRYCPRLLDVGDKPQLPSTWSAKADDILRHEPDLVLASVPYAAETIMALLQARLNLFCLYPERLADVYTHLAWLGNLTGAADPAQQQIAAMQARLAAIAEAAAGRPRPRVYVEMWPQPLMNSIAWVKELVEIAGGEFVPAVPGQQLSSEAVIAADPELIIVAWAGVADPDLQKVISRPGWEKIRAVRNDRVHTLNEILLNAPGPNLVDGGEQLAALIHYARFPSHQAPD